MKGYLKWFMEEFLKERFVEKDTLDLWLLKHDRCFKYDPKKIEVPHRYGEQLTLFELIN
ncbi:hypothetical protein PZL33_10515 [Staphylococcus hominis]|uniref:Uncharacterized protein n=2 Tax=Staphylococcus TaxID=1279 RepID=A0A8X8GR77_STAHO|nr:hypothetical protein [Staphylococcus hominis]ADA61576.1 hypothetical protein SAP020A_001 [Staphylococcus sp. CDC3]MCI2910953.1 hypothetical protein [Staphylococcus hominis]MCM5673025.1 hypothetical protein [Staphylococcus hominis]MDH9922376.1 hypothetical protein [Staphylococcus hominis]MDH9924615.1 hypothetical protein [Staphylococcus hominis]